MAVSAGMLVSSLASCGTALPVYKTTADKNAVTVPKALFAMLLFKLYNPRACITT